MGWTSGFPAAPSGRTGKHGHGLGLAKGALTCEEGQERSPTQCKAHLQSLLFPPPHTAREQQSQDSNPCLPAPSQGLSHIPRLHLAVPFTRGPRQPDSRAGVGAWL